MVCTSPLFFDGSFGNAKLMVLKAFFRFFLSKGSAYFGGKASAL
jgi:hypothetical protein